MFLKACQFAISAMSSRVRVQLDPTKRCSSLMFIVYRFHLSHQIWSSNLNSSHNADKIM